MTDKIKSYSVLTVMDEIFSSCMAFLTVLALGVAYYLFYFKITALPFILLASLLFGFGCLGLRGMRELRNDATSTECGKCN